MLPLAAVKRELRVEGIQHHDLILLILVTDSIGKLDAAARAGGGRFLVVAAYSEDLDLVVLRRLGCQLVAESRKANTTTVVLVYHWNRGVFIESLREDAYLSFELYELFEVDDVFLDVKFFVGVGARSEVEEYLKV